MSSSTGVWSVAPNGLRLLSGEVHVWRAQLERASSYSDDFLKYLTEDERDRAEKFHFVRDRHRFVMRRGVLRSILGGYLELSPGELRFSYGAFGKPELIKEFGGDWIRFNASSSHEMALFAFAIGKDLGIDVEWTSREIEFDSIAGHFFSPAEQAALRSLPTALRREAFYRCWTRKEAYMKGTGEGLSLPLEQFEVSLLPDEPARLINADWDGLEASRWSMSELTPGDDYLAAVAVSGSDWQLREWHWQSQFGHQ